MNRIGAMVADRPDWCISRQRSWGVPIPVFKCASCGETVATEETFDAVIDLFNTEGADAWFTKEPKEYLPEGTCCPKCGCTDVVPEKDILDVWWESGVSHVRRAEAPRRGRSPALACRHVPRRLRPASRLVPELASRWAWARYGAVALQERSCAAASPLDEEGEKMSKSHGQRHRSGQEVMRQVRRRRAAPVGRVHRLLGQDVSIGDNILAAHFAMPTAVSAIRSASCSATSTVSISSSDAVSLDEMTSALMCGRCVRLKQLLRRRGARPTTSTTIHQVFRARLRLRCRATCRRCIWTSLKDRLYAEAPDSAGCAASAQTVLMNILEVLVRVHRARFCRSPATRCGSSYPRDRAQPRTGRPVERAAGRVGPRPPISFRRCPRARLPRPLWRISRACLRFATP